MNYNSKNRLFIFCTFCHQSISLINRELNIKNGAESVQNVTECDRTCFKFLSHSVTKTMIFLRKCLIVRMCRCAESAELVLLKRARGI